VLKMLNEIINDTKNLETEATRDEEDAQKGYESFVANTNASLEEKNRMIINMNEEKAAKETELSEALGDQEGKNFDLDALTSERTDLHKRCDFVVKNFTVRQDARDQEVEALRQAKAILSGSNFGGAFLQKA